MDEIAVLIDWDCNRP